MHELHGQSNESAKQVPMKSVDSRKTEAASPAFGKNLAPTPKKNATQRRSRRESRGTRTTPRSKKWTGAGSNRRHLNFQSSALPTELPVRTPAADASEWAIVSFQFRVVNCRAGDRFGSKVSGDNNFRRRQNLTLAFRVITIQVGKLPGKVCLSRPTQRSAFHRIRRVAPSRIQGSRNAR